jgi:hypothetical protein
MNQVRPVAAPPPTQPVPGGQAETEQGITGDGQARQEQLRDRTLAKFRHATRFRPLPRADDRDTMAPAGEALHEVAERHGNAVDFRSVGFGYKGEIQ